MSLSLDGTAQRPPKRCSGVQIVSATHTGDKRMSVGKCMPADGTTAAHYLLAHGSLGALRSQGSSRVAYARQIEIVMRLATIISILRESHLPFSKNDYNSISNAVLAAQAFQHNADLLFSGMMPACGSANIPDCLFSAVRYALARLSHRCSSTGYDEPAILSYAISSFCPTSADGLQGIVLTMLLCSANGISAICSILTKNITTRLVRTYRCIRTRRSRAPSRLSAARWRGQFWADCITNISEPKLPTGTRGDHDLVATVA
jgi:hypothetical protein